MGWQSITALEAETARGGSGNEKSGVDAKKTEMQSVAEAKAEAEAAAAAAAEEEEKERAETRKETVAAKNGIAEAKGGGDDVGCCDGWGEGGDDRCGWELEGHGEGDADVVGEDIRGAGMVSW
jgi:hypothetical protein